MLRPPKPTPKPAQPNTSPLYRSGRLGCFIYKEGNENPINLKDIKATGNPRLNKMILNQNVDELWYETNPQKELWIKILLIGGLIITGLVIAILVFGNNQPPPI